MNDRYPIYALNYIVFFDTKTLTVSAEHEEYGCFFRAGIAGFAREGGEMMPADGFTFSKIKYPYTNPVNCVLEGQRWMEAILVRGEERIRILCNAEMDGVTVTALDEEGKALTLHLVGTLGTAENPLDDAFATTLDRVGEGLRAGFGPATSALDNAVLDRTRGIASVLCDEAGKKPESLSLSFDFDKNAYTFTYTGTTLCGHVRDRMFEKLFGIRYRAINKHNTFPTPPAGWMTWYSVQFRASEDVILENAAAMKEKLYDYGANVLWVDWEWQHEALDHEGPRGIDLLHPFPERYPHGLGYLAERLSDMELVPALWGGFTHDPGPCAFADEHPEAVLLDGVRWYGRYTFDPSSPVWREEYLLPNARLVPKLGYRALKWDVLPPTLSVCEAFAARMHDGGGRGCRALYEAVELVRRELGDDYYMMSCSGEIDRSVLFAADLFDGARIGGDVFSWSDFSGTVSRLCHLYSLHNTVFYCDPDNVVAREEYNTLSEARTRVSIVSLLGLPTTIGDELTVLPEERLELYRRALPAIDAHPMDVRDYVRKDDVLLVNLAVAKPFGSWNTVGILNLSEEERTVTLSLKDDLYLKAGRYHTFEFWSGEYRGLVDDTVSVTLPAHATAVLRLTKDEGVPTVVGTSRHITCGAPDLLDVRFDGGILSGRSLVVAGDAYTVTAADSLGNAKTVTVDPTETGEIEWSIAL